VNPREIGVHWTLTFDAPWDEDFSLLAVALVRSVAEFTLGALTAASIYPDGFVAIIAAHFDFRKHFEPDLRARRWKAIQKRTPAIDSIDGYRCIAHPQIQIIQGP